MKFALVDGQRKEAQPNLSGGCPACGQPLVAKCGKVRVAHWAHKTTAFCDPWWENESEWHRNWKDQFPVDWQEFVYRAADGEKHIADVRTDHEWVIEFQRSHISPEERQSRDSFYKKLVWVVDATRRKTDAAQFRNALQTSAPVGTDPQAQIRRVRPEGCRLLQEWSGSPAPIFFDFGNGPTLWWLLARRPDEPMYVAPWPRMTFLATHYGKGPDGARDFDEFTRAVDGFVALYNAHVRSQASEAPMRPIGYPPYFARRRRRL